VPVGGQRDLDETRRVLTEWLGRQMPEARHMEITNLVVPQATGFSNETFLFDVSWHDGAPQRAELVVRAQPQVWAVFPEIDVINQQYRTMKILGEHSDVPVAHVRWAEPDPAVLGTPFFVMDRLRGNVPGDRPPYTVEGWFMELTPAERRQLNVSGIEAMTRVNRVEWRNLDFSYLDKAECGPVGRQQRFAYFEKFWQWARAGQPHRVADPAWEYLRAHWPADEPVELCWGDARPGNQMYADGRVIAVMDWEMVSLGNAVSDLGWWLFLQRFHTEGNGVGLPEGMLTRDETIALWESLVGRTAEHVDFYEIVAGFHFTLVMMRITGMFKELDPSSYTPGADLYNPVSRLTAELLGIDLPIPTAR
jgi:aminoglycoside phosphotransferase (APT) family kinase protein